MYQIKKSAVLEYAKYASLLLFFGLSMIFYMQVAPKVMHRLFPGVEMATYISIPSILLMAILISPIWFQFSYAENFWIVLAHAFAAAIPLTLFLLFQCPIRIALCCAIVFAFDQHYNYKPGNLRLHGSGILALALILSTTTSTWATGALGAISWCAMVWISYLRGKALDEERYGLDQTPRKPSGIRNVIPFRRR